MAVAVGAALVAVSPAPAQETCYRIVDLGPLGFTPGIDDISGINNANQAVFTAVVNGKKHAMLYLPLPAYDLAAGVHDLHTLANLDLGVESASHDLNEAGIVVGQANNRAHVWRLDLPQHEFIDLGTFDTGTSSALFAINNDAPIATVVGDGNLLGDCGCEPEPGGDVLIRRAFALALEDPPDPLDDAALLVQDPSLPLPCQPNTFARDVKSLAALIVAGYSNLAGAVGDEVCIAPFGCGKANAATAWINPVPGDNLGAALAFLPPDHHFAFGGSQSGGVSDTGAMVGFAYTAKTSPCLQHAVYWDTHTADPPVDLGKATGIDASAQSLAVRINNNQPPSATLQAVGWKLASPDRAFLWECGGNCDELANWSATDLNDAIQHCSDEWSIRQGHDVNDDGWIIGWGNASPGGPADYRGVILFPDPNCQVCCFADLDCDGKVGASDLLALLVSWGPCDPPPAPCDADLDCDGTVGASDLLLLLTAWGPCEEPIAAGPPQDILDCVERFCCEEEDLLAFENCICLIDPECEITP